MPVNMSWGIGAGCTMVQRSWNRVGSIQRGTVRLYWRGQWDDDVMDEPGL
jgi:hypothetical protein